MSKQEFLLELRKGLNGLPADDIEERVTFYSEMIDDRIEDGLSEEDAVSAIGTVEEIVQQTVGDIPLTKLVKEKMTSKKEFKAWEIILLVLGSPIWFSLLIAAIAVILSIYISFWSIIVTLWSVFAAFIGSAVGCIALCMVVSFSGNWFQGIAFIGTALVCLGLSIFTFYGCKAATKGIVWITKKIALGIKNRFIRKEESQ